MSKYNIFRFACVVLLWLALCYILITRSQVVDFRVVFAIIASGIVIFVPIYKKYISAAVENKFACRPAQTAGDRVASRMPGVAVVSNRLAVGQPRTLCIEHGRCGNHRCTPLRVRHTLRPRRVGRWTPSLQP